MIFSFIMGGLFGGGWAYVLAQRKKSKRQYRQKG